MSSLEVVRAILERLEVKVDALGASTEKRIDDLELRLRTVEEYKNKVMAIAIIAGFVMPLIVMLVSKRL